MQATFTVGDEDNAIVLMAGVRNGGTSVTTRAVDGNHTNHSPFVEATPMALYIDGTWVGHAIEDTYKSTTGTITDETIAEKDNNHNKVTFTASEQRYWDDYGTADPANKETGRDVGLTIYAACVEGESTAPSVTDWSSLAWTLETDQTNGWAAKDLLTSNNIQPVDDNKSYATDGNYKFDDWMGTTVYTPSNILEFTHAMTQITVNLTAGEGFPGFDTGAANAKFQSAPEVTLLDFNYKGIVSVKEKTSTPTASTTTNIKSWRDKGATWTTGGQHTSQFTALVFPGNTFTATIANEEQNYTPTSATDILELKVDGNTFKVTAAQLVKAIVGTSTLNTPVSGTLEQGKNYIINILVNKTKIEVTATIKNWVDVNTEEVAPKINVTATYGYTAGTLSSTAFTNNYDLFRSTVKATGYDEDDGTAGINPAARFTSSAWDKTIYWPDHQTHYFFRGVYPQVGATVSGTSEVGAEAVTTVNGNDVIAVANAKYTTATYPSDLAIAIPRKPDTNETFDETCKVTGHNSHEGICATEGTINMNFEYAMSQVEVELKTVDSPDAAKVNINANTVVELVNVYNSGEVKLSDGSVSVSGDKGSYTLDVVEGSGNELKRHSAIVPQVLTYSTEEAQKANNLRFKITVTNDDAVLYANAAEYNAAKGTSIDDAAFAALSKAEKIKTPATTDVYYADVEPILKSDKSGKVAPNGKWESGVHYKYILTLSKTAIKVTATLKDWVTVTASDNIWF